MRLESRVEYDSSCPIGDRRHMWSNSACPNYSPVERLARRLTDKLSMFSPNLDSFTCDIGEGAISYKYTKLIKARPLVIFFSNLF